MTAGKGSLERERAGSLSVSQIIGIGIDIIEIKRIEKAMQKGSDRFRIRIFTDREVEYCEKKRKKYQHYAARFAAKEAAMKALGTGLRKGIGFPEIELINKVSGKPELFFYGKALEILDASGGREVSVSVSHSNDYAVATVVLSG